jgi:predicted O-methyltransferase YrrM
MQGNNFTRTARLVGNLLTRPTDVPRYLAHGPWTKQQPLDIGLPWFSYAAIDELEKQLSAESTVFEYGSGGSTVFFARRARQVTAVENNPAWAERVNAELRRQHLANVSISLHPFDMDDAVAFATSAYLQALGDSRPNIIVVDGDEGGVPLRPLCFRHAETRIAAGGLIVVDDSWRYPELRGHAKARRWRQFRGVGPCRAGVTTTDIYYY